MAALWDGDLSDDAARTPRRRRRATVGDWPRRGVVNAGALCGTRGALAEEHYDALITVGVRRDAPVDACTVALRRAASHAGLTTVEAERAGYVRVSGVVLRAGDARCELQLCCVQSRRVAAIAVRVAHRGARNADACARRLATAVRAVFADEGLRDTDDATPRRRYRGPSAAVSDSEDCGPGRGGLDAHFLGQIEAAARDAAFADHERRAAWLGAAARRAERISKLACGALGFAAPAAASPLLPPPPKALPLPPPTRNSCLQGAHAGVAARERQFAAKRATAAVKIADEAAWRACAQRITDAKEAVHDCVTRLKRNKRPVLRLSRALVDQQPAAVVFLGDGVEVGRRRYGAVLGVATKSSSIAPMSRSSCGRRRVRRMFHWPSSGRSYLLSEITYT